MPAQTQYSSDRTKTQRHRCVSLQLHVPFEGSQFQQLIVGDTWALHALTLPPAYCRKGATRQVGHLCHMALLQLGVSAEQCLWCASAGEQREVLCNLRVGLQPGEFAFINGYDTSNWLIDFLGQLFDCTYAKGFFPPSRKGSAAPNFGTGKR